MVDVNDDVDDMTHDLCEILASDGRDFLIRNNGDQVKISSLRSKMVGIYICKLEDRWEAKPKYCSEYITPLIVEVYREIASTNPDDFEVVMVSLDEDEDSFNAHFSQMPWLAVPHAHSEAVRKQLKATIRPWGFSDRSLSIVDKSGKVLHRCAIKTIKYYGAEAYPFTRERILSLNEEDAAARENQSLASLLGDYVRHSPTNAPVPVSRLEGHTVALYFQYLLDDGQFDDLLVDVYNQLKERGEAFEVVLVPYGVGRREDFHKTIEWMPWLALPLRDKRAGRLWPYFTKDSKPYFTKDSKPVGYPPFVIIIGPDGKMLSIDGATLIRQQNANAFPFTPQHLDRLDREAEQAPWTLESLLVFHGRDFVVRRDGSKVPVAELVGKPVMLYIWNRYSAPSAKIVETCRGIKEKDGAFEVIFIGLSKEDLESGLDDWMLALPGNDVRELRLYCMLHPCVPTAILFDSSGGIVTTEAVEPMNIHGAEAYPFSTHQLERLDEEAEQIAKGWPEKVSGHEIHEHEIRRVRCEVYDCFGCYWSRNRWNFKCMECEGFDLHNWYGFGGETYNIEPLPDGRNLMNSFITWDKRN